MGPEAQASSRVSRGPNAAQASLLAEQTAQKGPATSQPPRHPAHYLVGEELLPLDAALAIKAWRSSFQSLGQELVYLSFNKQVKFRCVLEDDPFHLIARDVRASGTGVLGPRRPMNNHRQSPTASQCSPCAASGWYS